MKKTLLILSVALLSVLGLSGTASASHHHYRGCGHSGYGYQTYAYATVPFYRPVPVYAYRPSCGSVVTARAYWHRHYLGGLYQRCHYYGGVHHYYGAYPPASGFHIGVSIFR